MRYLCKIFSQGQQWVNIHQLNTNFTYCDIPPVIMKNQDQSHPIETKTKKSLNFGQILMDFDKIFIRGSQSAN